jgi:uncharacterized OsmC-like protein
MHKYLVSYTYWDKEEGRQIFKAKTIVADLSGDPYSTSDKIIESLNVSTEYCITIIAISKLD